MATATSMTKRCTGRVTIPSEMISVVAPAGECGDFARIISAPVAFPHLFLAAMAHLGEVVEPYPDVPVDDVTA